MTTLSELRTALGVNYSDMSFTYNGKFSGVTSTVENYKPTFEAWHGDKIKVYHNVDAVLADKFYSGKSLVELASDGVDFWF